MNEFMTIDQVYDAMVLYLKGLKDRTDSNYLNILLKELELYVNKKVIGTAIMSDWLDAIKLVLDEENVAGINLTMLQGYKIMFTFLDKLYEKTYEDDLGGFLGGMEFNSTDNVTMDPASWHDWLDAVDEEIGNK